MTFIQDGTEGSISEGTFHPLLTTNADPPVVIAVLNNTSADLGGCEVIKVILDDIYGPRVECFKVTHSQEIETDYFYYVPVPNGSFVFTPSNEV